MENFLKIGLITKPQGVRGELKVNPLTDQTNRFLQLKTILIDQINYTIESVRTSPDAVFIKLKEVDDRNEAETFRGKFICVNRNQAVVPKKDSYFIADIIGCSLFTEKEEIGKVIDVTSAKTDYFTIKRLNGKIARFPFLKDLLIKVDIESSKIIVKEKRFLEVVSDED